jgi:hypothetical protein
MQTGHSPVATAIVNLATIKIPQKVENELRKLSQAVLFVRFFLAASVSALNPTFKRCGALKEDWHSSQDAGNIRKRYETVAPHNCRLSVDLHRL